MTKHDFAWYVKWVATTMIIISTIVRSFDHGGDYRIYDLAFGFTGICCWMTVSLIWNDKAMIMLNTVLGGFMLYAIGVYFL